MSRPEGMVHFIPPGQEDIQKFISSAANRSVRPYSTNEEYLYAMKEDLAEWFKELYGVNIHVDNFIGFLQDGILLCEHANRVNDQANEFRGTHRGDPMLRMIILPSKAVQYTPGHHASTFFARDNVANFIDWCRKELLIAEAVMFESNDLILKKNEKNFILCLLEVARRGSKFGVPAPVLIQMEEEIDEEIEQDLREEQSEEDQEVEEIREPPKQKIPCDFKSLDEMVQYILGMCSCPTQFPMVKVSEGKYKVGDSRTLIFMRILRNHVMVRVGGGWDTLEHYLDKHDPCRCNRHRVEQKITARIRDLGLVLTPDEEQRLISRAKRDTRDFKARNRTLSSRSSQGISVKQAAEVMDKAGPTRNSETSRSRDDWSNIKSQSLPGFTKELSTPSSGRESRVLNHSSEPSRSSKSSGRRSEAVNQNRLVHSLEVDGGRHTETRPAPDNTDRQRSHSPAPNRRSKALSRYSTTTKPPEIRVSKTGPNDPLGQTYPVGSRTSKSGNPLSSKTLSPSSENRTSPRSPLGRSKTPTPGSLRSSSTGSMSHCPEPRRSLTPTPTVTSQRRAELSLRAKSPNPDKMLATSAENKRPTRSKAPPSSYRVSETLPRNHRPMERSPRRETTTAVPAWNSSNGDKRYNSLPRPSSTMSYKGMTETDSGRKSTLSVSSGKSHHRSLQDIRQPPRPKSALGTYSSSSNLSTVPKTSGRKTIATTTAGNDSMQRLTTKSRSRSVDNLSIQKQLGSASMSTMNQRNQLFARLSQPKSTPKNRTRSNLLEEDVLFVERKGEGRHSVQRDSVQRPTTLAANSRSREERNGFAREESTGSEASSHSAQPSSDLRLRMKPFRGQGSMGSSTPSPSRDSALASSLRFSVSMSGSPDSPTSRVSCSWTPDSAGDELESPSSGQPIHTPKIIIRHKQESHLKAPPMRKVSKEEVLHVVRNPEGHHQWEHTDKSLEQSQEYIELSPYKEQLSPRSSQGERQLRSSIRNASSSSETSVISPGGPNAANMRVSKAQIVLGKPVRSSTPNRLTVATELQVSNIRRKHDVASTSSSSVASSRSSLDGSRRKPKITDQVRSMLFTEDGKAKPPNSSVRSPRISSTPRSTMNQRPTTPKNEVQLRLTTQSRSRPSTPRNPTRSTTPRPRPKTPDSRRGTLTRQEKLKCYDGPSPKKQADPPVPPEPQDKETRMLREFEREFSENQKILAASVASGDSEDTKSGNESVDHKMPVEYDYNGRRINKRPLRSKSPSNLKSKSAPRMQRMSSCDSELTNRSYERADSMADSEDFEVAMAMSGGAKRSSPSTWRSRSVDDFMDERGPKPRKDKHDSRKSRIPTPTHFNSGRKSATGVPYHDSNISKSALRSNVEGVGTYELDTASHRRGQGSFDDGEQVARGREKMKHDDENERRHRPSQDLRHSQKENIQPPSVNAWPPDTEEYSLDNQECFKFGRYRNAKSKSPRKNSENASHGELKIMDDGRQQFYHREELTPSYVENQYVQQERMQHFNSNNNNNNNDSFPIGQPTNQSEEPIPPPRKTGGYHRSNLHSSPADMLKVNRPTNQIHSRQNGPSNQNDTIQFARDLLSITREQQRGFLGHLPQDRSDSGIEAETDPDSPGSNSAISMRAKSGTSGSVFSPSSSQSWENHQTTSKQSPHEVDRSHVTAPQHGVLETPKGKYFFVAPGHQNSRLHTGYDAPRQNQGYQSNQVATGYQNQSRKDQAPRQHIVGISQPHQSPKPAFYQQGNQGSPSKNQSRGYQSSQQNGPKYQYTAQNIHPASYNQSRNQAPGSYQGYGSNQSRLDSSGYSPASPPVTSPSAYSNASDGRNASAVAGPRTRHQAQHSPINEQDRPEDAEKSAEAPSSRISKRPNFNDFFADNRKLKHSLNNLNSLYNEDPPGNAFQLEDVPFTDTGAPRSQDDISRSSDLYGNVFSRGDETPTSSPSKKIFPHASGGPPPQYATPPGYNTPQGGSNRGTPPVHYSSSTFPRSVRKDSNNNGPGYPNIGMGQYPQDDTAPAPPPRHKTQHKAFERQKLPTNAPRYYMQPDSDATFQFANGIDLRQTSEERKEEYV